MNRVALLLGLFAVPLLLLWTGHKFRRRSPKWRAAFWGAILGHIVFGLVTAIAAMIPAAEWAPTDRVRGVLTFWSLLVGPLAGALIATVVAANRLVPVKRTGP